MVIYTPRDDNINLIQAANDNKLITTADLLSFNQTCCTYRWCICQKFAPLTGFNLKNTVGVQHSRNLHHYCSPTNHHQQSNNFKYGGKSSLFSSFLRNLDEKDFNYQRSTTNLVDSVHPHTINGANTSMSSWNLRTASTYKTRISISNTKHTFKTRKN